MKSFHEKSLPKPYSTAYVSAYDIPEAEIASDFFSDPLYTAIIYSSAFQRLFHIPFLGGLSYTDAYGLSNTRADHSIGVALLAFYYSSLAKLSKIKERQLVITALLHDIDHFPFGHTMDKAIASIMPISHSLNIRRILGEKSSKDHESLEDLIAKFGIGKTTSRTAAPKKLNLLPLFYQKSRRPLVFRSTHNVDTLDGIVRASAIALQARPDEKHLPVQIISMMGSLRDSEELQRVEHLQNAPYLEWVEPLDSFWELKSRVYGAYIYEPKRVLFERILGFYLADLWRQNHSLEDLIFHHDEDIFDRFPLLRDRVQGLWHYIDSEFRGTLISKIQGFRQEKEHIGTKVKDKEYEEEKFLLTTRHFKINRRARVSLRHLTSLRNRYIVQKHESVLPVPLNLLKNLGDLLRYPLEQRKEQIVNVVNGYLI